MTSKNERVYSFSFVLFCHVGEILVEREKKIACFTNRQPFTCVIVFREQQKCKYQDFQEKIWFMMIYQDLFSFFYIYQ